MPSAADEMSMNVCLSIQTLRRRGVLTEVRELAIVVFLFVHLGDALYVARVSAKTVEVLTTEPASHDRRGVFQVELTFGSGLTIPYLPAFGRAGSLRPPPPA